MSGRLLVVGSVNVDLFTHVERHPAPGETLLGTGGERSPGGKGANQAVAAALQGAPVSLVGAVGADADADVALTCLRLAGVDLAQVVALPTARTGLAVITVGADGENTIVVIPGANAEVGPEQVQAAVDDLTAADLLLLQGELRRDTTEAALRAAAARRIRTVFNVAPWSGVDGDVLTLADPLVVNEHEAALAARELRLGSEVTAGQPVDLARALLTAGMRSVVITLGGAGAVVAHPDAVTSHPSPRVSVADTTGAGDAFTGALAARLLRGDDLATATDHAVRVGAYAVQHAGAQPSYPGPDATLS
ncbi:ribokinase [Serinicoccus marinus]|uniref:ribokinase n=1 Tax=Serinicoccus marinus TaxID=247333 RepID=UPI0003B43E58|nr:ribokinase [Serinicoccus marinus]